MLVVADDLGYSDLGSYGGEIDTPNLDRLAFAGVRFSRFYATPRCSPSRAALLTGVWPHQAGVAHLNRDWSRPAYRGAIRDRIPTLAERLRAAGYATYMAGKWHLTPHLAPEAAAGDAASPGGDPDPPSSWPLQRGFDRFYGTLSGSGSHFDPAHLYEGNAPVEPSPLLAAASRAGADRESGGSRRPDRRFHLTDELGERAAAFVEEHLASEPERPFFLYLAFTAPHWPLHAHSEDIERYRGRFDAGWDELRAARWRRLRELGVVDATAEPPPGDPRVEAWSSTPHPEWQARRMEVYAAMVSAMDRAVGRTIAALEEGGALDRTLVVFLSDNGASAEEFRGLYLLAPLVVPIPERTADGEQVRFGDDPSIVPGPPDTFSTYGRGWAHLSNTPLRLYKRFTHEGGIAVPFLVHWPAGLGERAGAIIEEPAHVVDVVPTVLEIASGASAPVASAPEDEARPPAEGADLAGGRETLRGTSLLALLRGEGVGPRTLYWEHEGNRAILDGDWKLVSRWPGSWELYDLAADRSETTDLAAAQPARATELERLWNSWSAEMGVEPWPIVVPQVRTALTLSAVVFFLVLSLLRRSRRRRAPSPSTPPPEPRESPEADREPEEEAPEYPAPARRLPESQPAQDQPAQDRAAEDRPAPIVPR
ncbi:MAG TPA: arylsulfatase [Thermoanaerobaculia bacterium]|nr:arylsulfatase [Thermoanaerobaculia bacterium]